MPTDSDFGNNTVTVTATDAHGKAISESFHLPVGDSGPTATAIANQSAFEGDSFSLNVSSHFAAPAAGDALTFSGSLPAGLSIDAHTGVISGTPTDSDFGNHAVTVTATDAHGKAISESFHLPSATAARPPPPSQIRVPMRAKASRSMSPVISLLLLRAMS